MAGDLTHVRLGRGGIPAIALPDRLDACEVEVGVFQRPLEARVPEQPLHLERIQRRARGRPFANTEDPEPQTAGAVLEPRQPLSRRVGGGVRLDQLRPYLHVDALPVHARYSRRTLQQRHAQTD